MQVANTANYVIPFIEQYFKIKPGTRVLEIGCGEAGVLKAFIDKGCTGAGVELEAVRLVYANEFLAKEVAEEKVFFVSKDIYAVDVKNELKGNFDIIVLKDVIEHIHDQAKLIARMKTLLNPAGVIFFGFPPWQMPYGGHQQVMASRFLNKLPYFHLLPMPLYKAILKKFKEDVPAFAEVKDTGISIERFERIVKDAGYDIVNKTHYLINPIYEYKFGWKPKKQWALISSIKYIRNFFTTCVYYLIAGK